MKKLLIIYLLMVHILFGGVDYQIVFYSFNKWLNDKEYILIYDDKSYICNN